CKSDFTPIFAHGISKSLGELAQLVQSTCLTSRGSLVRTQYSPPIYQREISSAGSEHLPYKQGVTGSNPVSPTHKKVLFTQKKDFFCVKIAKPWIMYRSFQVDM